MKIIVSNCKNGEIIETIQEATISQIAAVTGSEKIFIDGHNFVITECVYDFRNNDIIVHIQL